MNKTQNLVKILSDKLTQNRTKKIPKSSKISTSKKPRKSDKFKPHSHKSKHTLTVVTFVSCLTLLTRHTLARTGRIVGGAPVDANSGMAPWIVGVMPCDDSFTACGVCGSTSIADGFLISAAHCFDPHKHTKVYLYFNNTHIASVKTTIC